MRHLTYFFFILSLISINSFSQDDEEVPVPKTKEFIGSVAIGIGVPVGDLDAGYKGGIHLSANAGYIFSNIIGARFDASFGVFQLDAANEGGTMKIFSLRGDFLAGDFKRVLNNALWLRRARAVFQKHPGH